MQIWDVVVMKIAEVLESVLNPLCIETYKKTFPTQYIARLTDVCLKNSDYIRNVPLPTKETDFKRIVDTRMWLKVIREQPTLFEVRSISHTAELTQLVDELIVDFNRLAHRTTYNHFTRATVRQTAKRAERLIALLGQTHTGADESIRRIKERPDLLFHELNLDKFADGRAKPPALDPNNAAAAPAEPSLSEGDTEYLAPAASPILLEIHTENADKRTFVPDHAKFLVGRGQTNQLVIDDTAVSKRHLGVIFADDYGLLVVDLRSRNGTILEGIPIQPGVMHQWAIGQPITLGKTTLIPRWRVPSGSLNQG